MPVSTITNTNQRLYTPTFFIGFFYNLFLALHFTNNALYPLYVTHEGGSATDIGLFMGVYSVAAVFGRPLIGYLIDHKGVKLVLIIGSVFMALPNIIYLFSYDIGLTWLVWGVRMAQGFGFGAYFSAGFTLAGQIAPAGRRNEAISMYGISGLLGAFLGPVFGEYLEATFGMEYFFVFMTMTALMGTFIATRLKMERPAGLTDFSLKTFQALLRSRKLRVAMVVAMLLSVCYSTPNAFIANMAIERSIQGFGLYFTGFGAGGIAIRFIGGKWGDRFGLRRMLIPAFVAYFTGLMIVYFGTDTVWFFAGGIVTGIAHGIGFPAVSTLGYVLAPEELAGSAMSFVTGMMDAGTAITALLFGVIAEYTSYGTVFPIAAIAAVIAIAVLVWSLIAMPMKLKPAAQG